MRAARIIRWLVTAVAICVLTPFIEPVVQSRLQDSGYYDHPGSWWLAMADWVTSVFGEAAAPYVVGFSIGLASGMWIHWAASKFDRSKKPAASTESMSAQSATEGYAPFIDCILFREPKHGKDRYTFMFVPKREGGAARIILQYQHYNPFTYEWDQRPQAYPIKEIVDFRPDLFGSINADVIVPEEREDGSNFWKMADPIDGDISNQQLIAVDSTIRGRVVFEIIDGPSYSTFFVIKMKGGENPEVKSDIDFDWKDEFLKWLDLPATSNLA